MPTKLKSWLIKSQVVMRLGVMLNMLKCLRTHCALVLMLIGKSKLRLVKFF